MASSEPTIYEPGEKPELTKVFLENNKSKLFIQETQWRGHGDLPALIRPRGNPGKIPRGTFVPPDQWVVVTVGVGDVGVTSCGNEGEMLLQMFRNSASKGTSGLINLDQARDISGVKRGLPVRPGIFKQIEFHESNFDRNKKRKRKIKTISGEKPQGIRVCPNFILTSDPTKEYFTGYTRNTWDLRSLDSSYDIVYPIKEDTGIKFENAGNIIIGPASEYLASGKGDPEIFQTSLHEYLRMLTSNPSLNNSPVKTDASYSWTYRELWSYSLNDLKLLLENVLLVHFRGPKDEWSQGVKDYIESLDKTKLIKKICLYGKRLFISFNCSWLNKCGAGKIFPGIPYKRETLNMVRTTTEMTDLMEQARSLYETKYRYIVEGSQRSKVHPKYNGQFEYKQTCVKKFGLCVEDLSVYKEKGILQGSIYARAAQSIAKANHEGKSIPEYPDEVMDAFRGNTLKASDSTSSENSSNKRQRNRRRTEPIRRARSPSQDPERKFEGSFNLARRLADINKDAQKEDEGLVGLPIAEVSTTESLPSAKSTGAKKKRKKPKNPKKLKKTNKKKKKI